MWGGLFFTIYVFEIIYYPDVLPSASGTLFPIARSSDNNNWEMSGGDFALTLPCSGFYFYAREVNSRSICPRIVTSFLNTHKICQRKTTQTVTAMNPKKGN